MTGSYSSMLLSEHLFLSPPFQMERTNSCVDTMDNPGIKTDKTQLEIDNFVVKDFERGLCMGKRERIGSVTFR